MKSFIQYFYKTITVVKITTDMNKDRKLQRLSNLVEILENKFDSTDLVITVKEVVYDK
jgi:hypothetical protein